MFCVAQQAPPDKASDRARQEEESSSRDTRIDISPPKDDAKNHPYSKSAVSDLEVEDKPEGSDVQEFHPWKGTSISNARTIAPPSTGTKKPFSTKTMTRWLV